MNIFENGEFCPPILKKYEFTRSVFESFSPVHTKTLYKQCKNDNPSQSMHNVSSI